MLSALALLLGCQLAGEALVHAVGLPVPGPVIGLILMTLGLMAWQRLGGVLETSPIESLATTLLATLGLLFVPAGAGVVGQLGLLSSHWLAIGVVLVASTLITMVATVLTFTLVKRIAG